MLSKVGRRIRRRSVQLPSPLSETRTNREPVYCAPDLLRWSDFLDPFPSVAPGGYRRYYASSTSTFPQSPPFSPVLSNFPEPSSSFSNPPPTSSLFSPVASSSSSSKPERSLTVIREVSIESMTPRAPPRNRVSSNASSSNGQTVSLRRIRRQLLRTPSIERDFPSTLHSRHLSAPSSFSVNETSSSMMDLHSLSIAASRPTRSHSESSGSSHSHSSSSQSEYGPITPVTPLTPSTSMDSYGNGGGSDNLKVIIADSDDEDEDTREFVERLIQMGLGTIGDDPQKRRDSSASFSTAKTDFDDEDDHDDDNENS